MACNQCKGKECICRKKNKVEFVKSVTDIMGDMKEFERILEEEKENPNSYIYGYYKGKLEQSKSMIGE